jgi:phosphatidylinositol dimannoside acyltransferase
MPLWWMRYSPPFFGLAAAALVPEARRTVVENLRHLRGPASPWRDAKELAETFTTYACCLSETLAYGSKNAAWPELIISNRQHMTNALADGKGAIMATAHTAGWDVAGPVFGHDHHVELVLVMERERSHEARSVQDGVRAAGGLSFVHVGDDPLASLPLLRHLRRGAVVAMQMDRVPLSMRAREVTLLGRPARVPEGILCLAQVTGAPIVPTFSARLGFRRYLMEVSPPIRVPRRASDAVLGAAAQRLADAMGDFLSRRPTQWFHFRPAPPPSARSSRGFPRF